MFTSAVRVAVSLAGSATLIASVALAQSGSAAPGGATPSVAPGGATPSVAPGGAVPSVAPGGATPSVAPGVLPAQAAPGTLPAQAAPGTLPAQAAPGTLPQQAAPGTLPQQAAPGGAPAFIPSNNPQATPGAPNGGAGFPTSANGLNGGLSRSAAAAASRNASTGAATMSGAATMGQTGTPMSTQPGGSTANGTSATGMTFNGTPTTLGLNFGADGNGLRLSGITGDSFAQRAGLLAGDQLVGVNGQTVRSQAEFQSALRRTFGSNTPLNLMVRRNGQLQSIGVPLPSTSAGMASGANSGTAATGAFQGFNSGVSFSTGVANGGITSAGGANGLQVSQVAANSWAADAGLRVNDRIVGVDGQSVNSDLRLSSLLESSLQQNTSAQIMVNRNGVIMPLTVNRPAGFQAQAVSSSQITGNFTNDFGRFAGDFSQSLQQAQQASQQQFQQLSQFNDRITTLRGLTMSSTGQSADNVRILEQLRSLRSDLTAFNAQSSGAMQTQVQEFLTRLNQLNPSFADATAGPAAAKPGMATPTSPATPPVTPGAGSTPTSPGVPSTATSPATGSPR